MDGLKRENCNGNAEYLTVRLYLGYRSVGFCYDYSYDQIDS